LSFGTRFKEKNSFGSGIKSPELNVKNAEKQFILDDELIKIYNYD
jgi:hypothetical protein